MLTTASKPYETRTLGAAVDATAPDGTAVRLLLRTSPAEAWRISNCPLAQCRTRSRIGR